MGSGRSEGRGGGGSCVQISGERKLLLCLTGRNQRLAAVVEWGRGGWVPGVERLFAVLLSHGEYSLAPLDPLYIPRGVSTAPTVKMTICAVSSSVHNGTVDSIVCRSNVRASDVSGKWENDSNKH